MNAKRNYCAALTTLIISVVACTSLSAQTYRILVKENFGVSSRNPSAAPASELLPGITTYNPKTTLVGTALTSTNYPYPDDGQYAVGDSLRPFGWYKNTGGQIWQYGKDHTVDPVGQKGYMMIINADPTHLGELNGKYYQYSTSAFDVPGAKYDIDFWAANILTYVTGSGGLPASTYKPGYIGLAVRNTEDGTGSMYADSAWVLPRIPNSVGTYDTIPWQNKHAVFTLPTTYSSGEPLYFNFYNSDPGTYSCATCGNDLVLDDITIKMLVVSVSGNIFNDADGDGMKTIEENPINGITTPLYAVLTKADGTVISVVQVDENGNFAFDETLSPGTGVPSIPSNAGMKVTFTDITVSVGGNVSSVGLPAGYSITQESTNGATGAHDSAAANGILNLTSTASNISGLSFGIQEQPIAGNGNNTALNPGGSIEVTVPSNTFTNGANSTDPVPGNITDIRLTAFPAGAAGITINGINYTNITFPPEGIVIPADANGNPSQPISVDPASEGTSTVSIPFKAIDNAGAESNNIGNAILNLTTLTIDGTVYHDKTAGLPDGDFMEGVTVILYAGDGVTILATDVTDVNGNYSFEEIVPGNYVIGITLPDAFFNVSSTDGSPLDGQTNITVTSENLENVSFGINQPPVADDDAYMVAAGDVTGSILINDSLNSAIIAPGDVTVTPTTAVPAGFTLNADGTVTVSDDVISGTYTFDYEICENGAAPANCDPATVTLVVNNPIIAEDNSYTVSAGDVTTSILGNDSLNRVIVDPADVTVALTTAVPPGFTLNTDGTVTVSDDVISGTYTFNYEICENGATPVNCDPATVILVVNNSIIAEDNSYTVSAGDVTTSILGNDSLNRVIVDPADVTVAPTTAVSPGFTLNTDGTVTVSDDVISGTYTFNYEICENGATPANCDPATVILVVNNSIIAEDNSYTVSAGDVTTSILENDSLNKIVVDPADVTVTPTTAVPVGFTLNTDGTITVDGDVAYGTYTFDYEICENGATPPNCDPATVVLIVDDPLPVSLLYFEAKEINSKSNITWATATEINNKGFHIERSSNGREWGKIGYVASTSEGGNSRDQKNYEYWDNFPLPGTNFYRLRQEDRDGNMKYSGIALVDINKRSGSVIMIYPNPADEYLTIERLDGNEQIQVIDERGIERIEVMADKGSIKLDVSSLSAGTYLVRIVRPDNSTEIFKLSKK